jgi:hypothetical protein
VSELRGVVVLVLVGQRQGDGVGDRRGAVDRGIRPPEDRQTRRVT